MGAQLSPQFDQQFCDNSGIPLAGGLIYTYAAGTTTPLAAYTDSSGGTPQTNPIVLDANGRAPIWLGSSAYKMVLQNSLGVPILTVDNVTTFAIASGSITSAMIANGAIGTAQIATGGVATSNLAAGSVTAVKLAAGVGILPDLAVGPTQAYSTIGAAVAAATAGQSIYIQTGNYVENITLSKQVNIVGSGRGCVISGTLTCATGSDYSIVQSLKISGAITINSGVTGAQLVEFWSASGNSVTDNGTASFIQGYQE